MFRVYNCSLLLLVSCHQSTFFLKEKTIPPRDGDVKITLLNAFSMQRFPMVSIFHLAYKRVIRYVLKYYRGGYKKSIFEK
jgi:hypothetical protein